VASEKAVPFLGIYKQNMLKEFEPALFSEELAKSAKEALYE
jgi:hypothetical protein